MISICYTTGTFDLVHRGQIEFLKVCKQLVGPDGLLIVGLTSDELACKQKRKPQMSYSQRRDILVEFPFVNAVLCHNGEPKEQAWRRLSFTDLAIGTEYENTEEYKNMERFVHVHYIPCSLNRLTSSSQLTRELELETSNHFQILANGGPSGLIFMFNGTCEKVVIKPIRITDKEYKNTKNVYQMPVPNPRNWKRLGENQQQFPNIPGVNGTREIEVMKYVADFDWYSGFSVNESTYDSEAMVNLVEPKDDWSHINHEKLYASHVFLLHQHYCGSTLVQWIEQNKDQFDFVDNFNNIIQQVKHICSDLESAGVVHGDLHYHNICVQSVSQAKVKAVGREEEDLQLSVSVIDFGWCLARGFQLDDAERQYFETCIERGWDYRHFYDAMMYKYHAEPWVSELKF